MDISIENVRSIFFVTGRGLVENVLLQEFKKEVRVYSGKYNTVQTSVLFKTKGEEDYIYKPRKG